MEILASTRSPGRENHGALQASLLSESFMESKWPQSQTHATFFCSGDDVLQRAGAADSPEHENNPTRFHHANRRGLWRVQRASERGTHMNKLLVRHRKLISEGIASNARASVGDYHPRTSSTTLSSRFSKKHRAQAHVHGRTSPRALQVAITREHARCW